MEDFISDGTGETLASILGQDAIGGPTPWGTHRWRDLLRCPKRYYYRYEKRLIPVGQTSEALEFGLLIHELLARHYRRENPWLLIDRLREEKYKVDLLDDAERVFHSYLNQYPKKKDPYYQNVRYKSWIERVVEVVTTDNGGVPFGLTTRIDHIYQHKSGIIVVDHKTSNAMTSALTQGFMFDPQIMTLALASRVDDKLKRYKLLGVEINAIVRTKEPQFTRIRHKLDWKMIERFRGDLECWYENLIWAKAQGWPRYYACISQYRKTCEYRDACLLGTLEGLEEAPEGRVL